MKKVYFRVDAYKEIGIGHLTRCLALAQMLVNRFEIYFIIQPRDPKIISLISEQNLKIIELSIQDVDNEITSLKEIVTSEDFLVLDGYQFNHRYQEKIKKLVNKLIFIDDLNQPPFYADLIINHNLHAIHEDYHVNGNTRVLLGAEYLMLRDAFFDQAFKRKSSPTKINSIIICMGGADRENLTLKFLKSLSTFFTGKITCVVGIPYAYYDELKLFISKSNQYSILQNLSSAKLAQSISQNDLLICTSSMIAAEACALETPMILGFMEKNQERIADIFSKEDLAVSLGDLMAIDDNQLPNVLKNIIETKNFSSCIQRQKVFIDGQSGHRLVAEFIHLTFDSLKITTPRFNLRQLKMSDVNSTYLSWLSDSTTRRFIKTSQETQSVEVLQKYVSDKLQKSDVLFLGIFEKDSSRHIGNVKFEPINFEKKYAIMGILIGDSSYRGIGAGPEVLSELGLTLKKLGITKMVLGVESENIAAIRSYEKIGFRVSGAEYINFTEKDKSITMLRDL